MDLSFTFPVPTEPAPIDVAELPAPDVAALVALIAERQAESATALAQAVLGERGHPAPGEPLAPTDGAFNIDMVARLIAWQQG